MTSFRLTLLRGPERLTRGTVVAAVWLVAAKSR
jgi:hypothetical protein